ncbi:MAG: hypothetical protein QM820_07050 [Minicystis sp.]
MTILTVAMCMVMSGCAGVRPEGTSAPAVGPVAITAPMPAPAVSTTPAPVLASPSLLPLPAPEPPAPLLPPAPPKPHSALLRSGFYNPMPGGVFAGYQADTGLDIAGTRLPVYALAAGTLDYSEPGHTLWTGPSDTANCVRFELDTPIPWKGRRVTHVYYAHLSKLENRQAEGESPRRHVEGGELLGVSGVANHSPHLHIGLLLDGEVDQRYWGTFLLADEIRKVLGGYRNGDRL